MMNQNSSQIQQSTTAFSPLIFLASLGAGGIAVIPFAFLQYTMPHGKGMVTRLDVDYAALSGLEKLLHYGLDSIMIIFALLHLVLTIIPIGQLKRFISADSYQDFIHNPLKNTAILAPFISLVMTMNVFIGPVRYFIPVFADNLQLVMAPALATWILIYFALMRVELKLLKISFVRRFDVSQISFGWLLHSFALAMLTVTGTGFAALAEHPMIAHTAAILTFISGTMGLFLFVIKLFSLFNRYFEGEGLGDKHLMPSFLIVIPNITLYAISFFRIGHYFQAQHGMEMGAFFALVTIVGFAFETWYLLFGLVLLSDYFKKDYFQKEYYVSQWGLICPMVAYAVLAAFTYYSFLASPLFIVVSLVFMVIAIVMFFDLLRRYWRCRSGQSLSVMRCL